ncbi:hypothetical protein DPMN_088812 [Dreissena polymorpha]|uniref:EGF-like domain-containing protein n=1 Tax=Dreissena polymorpha TaxID=45954 RepID=A0A9D4QY80_DREPO|nr:hypothetical protein DPMN_088812 [Dreissena polymorpha]
MECTAPVAMVTHVFEVYASFIWMCIFVSAHRGSKVLTCVHGYTGKLCDTEIDECVSQPCQHGGQCVDSLNHYTYMCLDGFDGEHCQNEGPVFHICHCLCVFAHLVIRENSAKKVKAARLIHILVITVIHAHRTQPRLCVLALSGLKEVYVKKANIDECSSNPFRSNGICHDETGVFRCECPHGYSGLDCSNGVLRRIEFNVNRRAQFQRWLSTQSGMH